MTKRNNRNVAHTATSSRNNTQGRRNGATRGQVVEVPQFSNPHAKDFQKKRKVELLPRNVSQEKYIRLLNDRSNHIVFALGPAGTGKTMLATQFAIKALQAGEIERVIITRPAVSSDEEHGFLPGTLIQKMEPWVMPILDVFKEHYHPMEVQKMLEDGTLEVSPLAYMRGRTFKRAIVIFDESQNATPEQMKLVMSRIGEGARIVVTGDVNQHDSKFKDNGLRDFVSKFEDCGGVSGIAIHQFALKDVERHPVIESILRVYGED